MKTIITALLITISTFVYTQVISTNVCSLVEEGSLTGNIELRQDIFELREDIFIWRDLQDNKTIIFFVESIHIINGIHFISCNTNGKRILFKVSFDRAIVGVGDNLIFFNLSQA